MNDRLPITPSTEPRVSERPISPEMRESREARENRALTNLQLETLKREIESGNMSLEMIKGYIEGLEDTDPKNKPFILWGIFSWLNQMWISLESIWNGKIVLTPWKQWIRERQYIASRDKTKQIETLLNNGMWTYFTPADLQKALLYRTHDSIQTYLASKFEGQESSTSEYALFLLEKYKISVQIDPNLSETEKRALEEKKWTKAYFEKINFENENAYKRFIATIKSVITDNQAEKEFLVWFFDDLYYHQWNNINDRSIEQYKQTQQHNQAYLFRELNSLSQEQKYALWIRSENQTEEAARRWSNNPLEAVKYSIENGGLHLWVILWIVWAIFFWKKWFFWWLLAWIWLVWGGISLASEGLKSFWENNFWKQDPASLKANPSQKPSEQQSSYFSKINFSSETNSQKRAELQRIWWDLSKNDNFLKAPTTVLSIFESTPPKSFEQIQNELTTYWIKLTSENKNYYATIFAEIVKQRAEYIWEPKKDETIEAYLTRSSGSTEAAVTTPVETDSDTWIAELEQLRLQWYTDLYILSRWIELGYTFTKTLPDWVKPNWNMWILGSTWYVIKTPLRMDTYRYIVNAWWHFITWWLHRPLQSRNPGRMIWWTWEVLNWIWNKASELLQFEIKKEKANLERYLQWIDTTISWNNLEVDKITSRLEILDRIENNLNSWNNIKVKDSLNEYRTNFDQNFMWKWEWKKIHKILETEIQKFQKIEADIQKIETETRAKIQELETRAKSAKTPDEIRTLRTEAENFAKTSNIEIERLNKEAALALSQLDESSIKWLSADSKFVDNLIKANGWAAEFLSKFNGTWGKAFKWIGIISLLYNGREWLGEIWENGLSEENKNDAIDLWIGFIPVIGWIHDLKIAWDGKDLNDRTLSTGERWLRTAFGIVWLIPGAWVLVKWAFKWTTAVVKWADVAIETTNVVWKWLTYTLLWFSIATATKEIVFE